MATAVRRTSNNQLAPPGFTPEQWASFERDGIIFLEDALSPDEIQRYTDAIERVAHADPKFRAADRILSDPEWIRTLSREQRIIMRSYDQAYNPAKPPATEFPLFLDRDTGSDPRPGRLSRARRPAPPQAPHQGRGMGGRRVSQRCCR